MFRLQQTHFGKTEFLKTFYKKSKRGTIKASRFTKKWLKKMMNKKEKNQDNQEKQEKRSYLLPKLQVRVITLRISERQGLRETPLRMLLMEALKD